MKTPFSYFPGMFENIIQILLFLKPNQKYYEILTKYECAKK